jgi:hypothetical protein
LLPRRADKSAAIGALGGLIYQVPKLTDTELLEVHKELGTVGVQKLTKRLKGDFAAYRAKTGATGGGLCLMRHD